MAGPFLTGLPDDLPELTAFAGFLQSLRDDPGLLAISPKVNVWGPEGEALLSPMLAPAPAIVNLPLIRVWPGNYPSRWENEGQHSGKLDLNIELICPGIHYQDRFGLWTAFYRAVYPPDVDRNALVLTRVTGSATGLVNFELRQAATAPVQPLGSDLFAQKTTAILTLTFQF